jgi:hypothetical protein
MLGQKQWGTLGRGAPFAFRNDASRVKTELALYRTRFRMTQIQARRASEWVREALTHSLARRAYMNAPLSTALGILPPSLAHQMTQLGQNYTLHRKLYRSS